MSEVIMKYRNILALSYDFDMEDEASIRAHHDELHSLRNAALQGPLVPDSSLDSTVPALMVYVQGCAVFHHLPSLPPVHSRA
ncbi:hypothetical protein EW146_g5880 [Bondarzewia mesenterica]|uniref:Uncharacterized protein n=1 Tax=Bondarzewia mesenterica TaxID=1095465 RepID=A0A4S4LQ65_9AGAM|nr:hypothetical protein EW146_g5880 [Bondarzewia mesenterica]